MLLTFFFKIIKDYFCLTLIGKEARDGKLLLHDLVQLRELLFMLEVYLIKLTKLLLELFNLEVFLRCEL